MNIVRDRIRFSIISPETVVALLPFLLFYYSPELLDILIKPMKEGVGFGLGAVAIPIGMLAFNYKEGLDLLAPTGAKKVLLEWPDYPALKGRVLATFVWCVIGATCAILAVGMVSMDTHPRLGITLLLAGLLASAASTATMGLARFAIRELIVD
jgi:hypothetical protein